MVLVGSHHCLSDVHSLCDVRIKMESLVTGLDVILLRLVQSRGNGRRLALGDTVRGVFCQEREKLQTLLLLCVGLRHVLVLGNGVRCCVIVVGILSPFIVVRSALGS